MKKKFKYVPFSAYEKRKKIVAVLVCFSLLFAFSAGLSTFLLLEYQKTLPPPKDKEMSVVLSYLNPDMDFGVIVFQLFQLKGENYSGIQYFLDGVAYMTTSDTIFAYMNDFDEHNLTIYFGGEVFEYIWTGSLTQAVELSTKSISSVIYFDEIMVASANIEVDLWYNGILIETATTDANGLVTFENLIFGEGYVITEHDDVDSEVSFTLEQDTAIYTDFCVVIAEKNIIDIDYLNTIFGGDYPVDISLLDYTLEIYSTTSESWIPLLTGTHCFYIVEGAETITIYEIKDGLEVFNFRIVINNAWSESYEFLGTQSIINVDLVAKSLEAQFLWSSDSSPMIGESFNLMYWDGDSWELVGTYVTDAFGYITITEMLPAMDYKFDDFAQFSVSMDDTLVSESYTISSLFGEGKIYHHKFRRVETSNLFFLFFQFFYNYNK